jgi:ribosome-associated protein YbcJ (S4-like RNA binding protein)
MYILFLIKTFFMITEKEQIKRILENRGILVNGVFDEYRFKKLVTEPWINIKTKEYGFDKMTDETAQPIDNEQVKPVEVEEQTIVETVVETVEEETVVEPVEVEVEEQTIVEEETVVEQPKKKTTKKK